MKISKVLVTLLATSSVFAGNIGAAIALPSAKVLPKGVRNITLKGVIAEGTDKYNSSGEITPLSDPFFNQMSFQKSLDGELDPVKRGEIEAAMVKAGASAEDSFGLTQGQVNLKANVTVPVFAIGLTEKFTAAIAVPIIKTSLNVDTAAIHTNEALFRKVTDQLALAPTKQYELTSKLSTPITSKMDEYGYESLEDEDETKLGDIKLVGKYKVFGNKLNSIVIGGEVVLPTGREENPDKLVDLPGGDGQTDIGISLNYDLTAIEWLTLSAGVSHLVQIEDTTEKRIPYQRDSKLTPYKDKNTSRDLGDISTFQLAVSGGVNGFKLGSGYTFQYKQGDKYSGNEYQSEYYEFVGKDTIQNMHNATVTVGYDTISLFKKKLFPVPLSLSLTHTQTFAGKNVVKDPLTVVDFAVFF